METKLSIKEQTLSVQKLIQRIRNREKVSFTIFYGHFPKPVITESCFSQWFIADFVVDGKKYICMEQYMMEQKALLFGDTEVAAEIMRCTEPKDMKNLGRKAKGFSASLWDAMKYTIVYNGNIQKFGQNKGLLDFLLSTGDSILVEASPYDKIWGIGLDKKNPLAKIPEQWLGENLLGFALTEVREYYRNTHTEV